jgi:hypothetical protein
MRRSGLWIAAFRPKRIRYASQRLCDGLAAVSIRYRGTAAAFALALATVLLGCGEKTLSAKEFVDAVREEGVELALDEELFFTEDEDKELYGLEVQPLRGAGAGAGGHQAHTSGSLAVYDEVDQAREGLEQCRSSADLVCYRAANIVVILEDNSIEAQRLAVAIGRLEE